MNKSNQVRRRSKICTVRRTQSGRSYRSFCFRAWSLTVRSSQNSLRIFPTTLSTSSKPAYLILALKLTFETGIENIFKTLHTATAGFQSLKKSGPFSFIWITTQINLKVHYSLSASQKSIQPCTSKKTHSVICWFHVYYFRRNFVKISHQELEEMMKAADPDGDGKLSLEEFRTLLGM